MFAVAALSKNFVLGACPSLIGLDFTGIGVSHDNTDEPGKADRGSAQSDTSDALNGTTVAFPGGRPRCVDVAEFLPADLPTVVHAAAGDDINPVRAQAYQLAVDHRPVGVPVQVCVLDHPRQHVLRGATHPWALQDLRVRGAEQVGRGT